MIQYIKLSSLFEKILLILWGFVLYKSIMVGTSYYTMAFCVLAFFMLPIRRYLDKQALWLIFFSVLYSIFHILLGISSSHISLYFVAPLLFYCFGSHITRSLNSRVSILEFVAITVFLFSLVTYYTCIIDIRNTGLINPMRIMGRVGGEEYDMAATLYGLNVSLGLACLFGFFSIEKQERTILHFLMPLSFLMALITTIHLVNRTGLVLLFFSLLIFFMYNKKGNKSTWIILVLVVFVFLSTKSEFTSITDAYTSRSDIEGHGLTDAGSRTDKWIDSLVRLFTSPWGWYKDVRYTFAHNMWLDVARLTGIIPFIAIVGTTVVAFKNTLCLYRVKNDSLVLTLVSIMSIFFLESFVEPVLEGFDLYFYLMCMFLGIQKQYLNSISYE